MMRRASLRRFACGALVATGVVLSGCGSAASGGSTTDAGAQNSRGGTGGASNPRDAGASGAGGRSSMAGGASSGGASDGGRPVTGSGGAAGASDAATGTDAGAGLCKPLSLREDGFAFEVRITNTSDFYKLDFPPEVMDHCIGQRNAAGVTDPAMLETKCEASYLFKKTAGTAPASPITESFDVVIPYVPATGIDLKVSKGGKGTTQYELRGLDGTTWVSFDQTKATVHVAREAMKPGGLASRIPATPVVGPKRGAYLFPWYGTPAGPAGHWVHWDPASPTLYTPAKGLYDSADPAVIAEQMAEARSAGIDLFVVSYWDTENPPLAQYLDAASKVGIEISAMLETSTRGEGTPRQSVVDQLTLLATQHGDHPSWLKANGKPIVFVYDRVASELDDAKVGATGWDDWQWIKAQMGGKMPVLMFPLGSQWGARGAAAFGGGFAFAANSGGGSYFTGSHGDDWAWAWTARQAGALLAIPILPSIGRLRQDSDEPNYRNQWHAARAVIPDMIIVNSWNEYHESTIIEPTTAFGTHWLDLTKEEGALFCRGELGSLLQGAP